jgi:lipopolysaccharide export system protein LptA
MTVKAKRFSYIILCLLSFLSGIAQVPIGTVDTTRTIQIVRADVFREKRPDSITKLQILAGNVVVREASTIFSTDSAVINRAANTVDAYGNVHINESDTVHTYANYLRYVGNERKAYLKRNVVLKDRRSTLTTQELEYDMATGVGSYSNGGKITNRSTVLTSREGTYFSATKDIFFRNNVRLVDPKYDIKADSLQYNTATEVVNFTGPTVIKSKDAEIFTRTGYYDLKAGKAFFGNNPLIKDSAGRTYRAINVAIDEKTNVAQLEGNAVVKDSANGFTITGGQIFLNSKNNSFLASRKPVLIIQQENDSTYIAADTLFSGLRARSPIIPNKSEKANATVDSFRNRNSNLLNRIAKDTSIWADSVFMHNNMPGNAAIDSIKKANDSLVTSVPKVSDTGRPDTSGRVRMPVNKATAAPDSMVRYFLAFANVRIFNDSLQAVADSLSYSGEDSVFRLYKNPIAWSGQNQLSGDTLYMFTKNKKAERLYVFENALVINKTVEDFYNQIAGRTLNAYFIEGNIDYMRSKGSPAESIYFIQDKDSAFVGMNRASGSVIDLYFKNKELKKVLFVNDVKGTMFPIRQIPIEEKFLKNFKWHDSRRPKSRLELFE